MDDMDVSQISLRAPEITDLNVIFEIENDTANLHSGLATGHYSRFQIERYIRESSNDLYEDKAIRWMIVSEEQVVGMMDIFHFDARQNRAEVGIFVLEPFRGKGIACQALKMLERHCFEELDLHQLYAYVAVGNTASCRLFLHAGYENVGRLKDWIKIQRKYEDVLIFQRLHD